LDVAKLVTSRICWELSSIAGTIAEFSCSTGLSFIAEWFFAVFAQKGDALNEKGYKREEGKW
jgi:hypothetical protein